ncbi:MAG TPA: hypothetical protein V6C81_07355 [Planktothrix sp.]|jgi:hypothetical protein
MHGIVRTGSLLTLSLSLAYSIICLAPALADYVKPAKDQADGIEKKIADLVAETYPKATVTRDEGKLHFELRVRKEKGSSADQPLFVPQKGGILGDVYLSNGEYTGPNVATLNIDDQQGDHTTLLMAPFSKSQNVHLMARLVFPEDAPKEFRDGFRNIVDTFDVRGNTVTDTAKAAEAPPPPVPRDLTHQSESYAPADKPVPEPPKPPGYDAALKLYNAQKWAAARQAFQKFVTEKTADATIWDEIANCDYHLRQYRKSYSEWSYVSNHSPHNLTLQGQASRNANTLATLMSGACPGNCLKRSSGYWRMHPDGTYWYQIQIGTGPGGWTQEFSEAHVGHILVRAAHMYEDHGPCPICGGTGRVKALKDGDPLPSG